MVGANKRERLKLMGGRGAYAVRRRVGNFNYAVSGAASAGGTVNLKNNDAGGGGATIETDFGKFTVNSLTHNGSRWSPVNTTDGKLVITDAKGVTHTSIQVSSGSTRVTYEFKDFALKFEGLFKSRHAGQNAKDEKAYARIPARMKHYVAGLKGTNQNIVVGGKKLQVIPVERIIPIKGKISQAEHDRVARQFNRLKYKAGVGDIRLGNREGAGHYNVYFARRSNGKIVLKSYDYALEL